MSSEQYPEHTTPRRHHHEQNYHHLSDLTIHGPFAGVRFAF